MKPATSIVLWAGLLSVVTPEFARAGSVTLVTTPFAGVTTNYSTIFLGNFNEIPLPYTDAFGLTVSGNGGIIPLFALSILPPSGNPANTAIVTWSNLAAGTNAAGITMGAISGGDLIAATFSNGDTFSGTVPLSSGLFVGFTDTTPFTTVALDFTGNISVSHNITDFRTATISSVPEPSSVVIWGWGAVIASGACLVALRRRQARRGSLVG